MKKVSSKVPLILLVLSLIIPLWHHAIADEVTAYKNPHSKIIVDGQELRFADAGKSLDLLMLDGVTYAPVMQLTKALGKEIVWDQQDKAFYIGVQPGGVDLIDDFKPYSIDGLFGFYPTSKGKTINITNKEYSKYVYVGVKGHKVYYNLEGKFSSLSFLAYCDSSTNNRDAIITVFGDNDAVLYESKITYRDLPTSHTVDVRGVYKLVIENTGVGVLYIMELYAHQ